MNRHPGKEPPEEAPFAGANPGISVRRDARPGTDVAVDGDASLLELHRRLLEAGLADDVVDALRRLDGEGPGDFRVLLREQGVEALNDHLADVLADAAQDLRDLDLDPDRAGAGDVADRALDILAQLGDGTVDGLPSDLDDLDDALPPLFASSNVTPTIAVRLGVKWAQRRPEQREAVLKWLSRLAVGCRVDLVTTEVSSRTIVDVHRDAVPTTVLRQLCSRGREPPAPLAGEADEAARNRADRVSDALDALDPDGRPAGVLAALARSPADSLIYADLSRSMALDSPPYEAVRVLDDTHGLVERAERADGRTVVSLRPAGLDALRRLSVAASASSSDAVGVRSDGGQSAAVSGHPQNLPSMPYYPRQGRGDPPGEAAAEGKSGSDDRPAGEGTAATVDRDRLDGWQTGLVTPQWAPRSRWLPAVESTDAGEVGVVDVDLDLADDRDGREPAVSYDRDTDTVYVGAEYSNPMQAAVTLAHGLTSELLWSTADWEDRIGSGLRGLDISEHGVLHSATRVGWLPLEANDGEAVLDELRSARDDDLLELTRELATAGEDDDVDAIRSELARVGMGLIGTIVNLLDLLGVRVVLDLRVDDFSRHFSAEGNEDRREDLVEHLGTLTGICSRTGAFATFAQLFEHRDSVREDAWSIDVPEDGALRGRLRCSLLLHGAGVEDVEDELAAKVQEPRDLHPDAPSIAVDVDLRVGTSAGRTASTVRRMLRSRGLQPTAPATAVIGGFAAGPWAAADAVHWGLERESRRRDVHLDEARRALATLDAGRLLTDAPTSARAGVAALLRADEPLSQAELSRRAGISDQSWRNHREGLVAADVVRKTPEGWRVALPFREERGRDVDVADPPWWLLEEGGVAGDVGREGRRPADVLDWLLLDRGLLDAPERLSDDDDPLGRVYSAIQRGEHPDADLLDGVFKQAGVPPSMIRAGCGSSTTSAPISIAVGPLAARTRQMGLSSFSDDPQNPPING